MLEKLNDSEKLSSTWIKIKKMLESELYDLRLRNDGGFGELTEIETAKIRGSISLIKALLDIECPEENYGDQDWPPTLD